MLITGLTVTISMTGCNGGRDEKIPQIVKTAFGKMYPAILKIDWDEEENNMWEAEFINNGIETSAVFYEDGTLIQVKEEIFYEALPQAVRNYITRYYPNASVKDTYKITDADGNITYRAEAKDNDLIFDAQGNFININNEDTDDAENDKTENNNSPSDISKRVDIDELPQIVKEFVKENYKGYKIENAEHDPMCDGSDAIDVAVKKAGSIPISLIFTPDGKFIQQEEDIDIKTAPSKVIEILRTKYADYAPGAQIEKLILPDKSVQYMIDLSKNGISKEVIFDTKGNVVCEH